MNNLENAHYIVAQRRLTLFDSLLLITALTTALYIKSDHDQPPPESPREIITVDPYMQIPPLDTIEPLSELTPVEVPNYFQDALSQGKFIRVEELPEEDISIYKDTDPAPPTVYIVDTHDSSINPKPGLDFVQEEFDCTSDTTTWYLEDSTTTYIDEAGLQEEIFLSGADYVEIICTTKD